MMRNIKIKIFKTIFKKELKALEEGVKNYQARIKNLETRIKALNEEINILRSR